MTDPEHTKNLVVLGCSETKIESSSILPAITLYDGPTFRVLRSFLRDFHWPEKLSIAVLSANYGLIGGVAQISKYNRRMTPVRAAQLCPTVTSTLRKLGSYHHQIDLVMGRDYLSSINLAEIQTACHFASGSIGMKLNHLHSLLRSMATTTRVGPPELRRRDRPLYFLPDWDDFVDSDFDFAADQFSSNWRQNRREEHTSTLMKPEAMCDGVLVSLAQHLGSKGVLRRFGKSASGSLAPKSVRQHFGLLPNQWAFGDCGAFSYASEDKPSIGLYQAIALYELYNFDLGASVDHIPLPQIAREGKTVLLTAQEKASRVRLTRDNADQFLRLHRRVGAHFVPVGVIQGVTPEDYAKQVADYLEMGYEHLALGGLVPRNDYEVARIVEGVAAAFRRLEARPWLHLLGIFRPSLQSKFRLWGVNSFDSATYFRKAWLRSDQNYLGNEGKWYAAIRVPPTNDARTLLRMKESGLSEQKIRTLEKKALNALHDFAHGRLSVNDCLKAIRVYDALLKRRKSDNKHILQGYRATLEAKPWQSCKCNVCTSIGIDVLIFRGLNRNKRRGAHNTLQLYRKLTDIQ